MGNKSSSSCSSSGSNSGTNDLTDYDMTIYKERKEKIFYGTIAICVTYGIIAILLLIASYLSDKIRFILLTRFLPFTVVYIMGTIIIVIFLLYQVLNFQAIKIEKPNKYDENSCPDYWTLKTYKSDDIKNIFDTKVNTNYLKNRCVLDNNKIYNKNVLANTFNYKFDTSLTSNMHSNLVDTNFNIRSNIIKKITKDTNYNDNIYYDLVKSSFIMNNYKVDTDDATSITFTTADDFPAAKNKSTIQGYTYNAGTSATEIPINTTNVNTIKYYKNTNQFKKVNADNSETPLTNVPMVCDFVYPAYLASQDLRLSKDNSKLDQNVLRCAYSKMCNIPWSEINCDSYF